MKKIVSIILVLVILASSLAAFADGVTPVVTLLNVDVVPEGHELIRGFVISYENQTVTLKVDGKDYPVTVYDQNNTFVDQLSTLRENDHIELIAEKGEATYLLTQINVINPIMDSVPMPVLYTAPKFELTQDGDTFVITLDENASTGYVWTYTINKTEHVTFISEETINSESGMVGASGKRVFTFKVEDKGVSTISFENSRSFEENSTIDTLEIMVYKTEDNVFVEENTVATIDTDLTDSIELISYEPTKVYYNDTLVNLDVDMQVINGVTMIPLAETLRAMGYEVKWVEATQSVEISKGAQWTSITIGKNAYFKNRMAARPLSAAPVIVNNRTLVPAEFFTAILDLGFEIESGSFKLNDYQMGHYSGYVSSISTDETGAQTLTLVYDLSSITGDVIIHTSNEFTYFNKVVEVGTPVEVISSMMTTMSIPPQTSGYIIY